MQHHRNIFPSCATLIWAIFGSIVLASGGPYHDGQRNIGVIGKLKTVAGINGAPDTIFREIIYTEFQAL